MITHAESFLKQWLHLNMSGLYTVLKYYEILQLIMIFMKDIPLCEILHNAVRSLFSEHITPVFNLQVQTHP